MIWSIMNYRILLVACLARLDDRFAPMIWIIVIKARDELIGMKSNGISV